MTNTDKAIDGEISLTELDQVSGGDLWGADPISTVLMAAGFVLGGRPDGNDFFHHMVDSGAHYKV